MKRVTLISGKKTRNCFKLHMIVINGLGRYMVSGCLTLVLFGEIYLSHFQRNRKKKRE